MPTNAVTIRNEKGNIIGTSTSPLSITTEGRTTDPMLEIAKGNVLGTTQVNKFGANSLITDGTTEDVWDGGGTYTFPTTADITHIREAVHDANDVGATIEVQGLDINYDLVVQTITLDATTTTVPVALTTPLLRVFRMKVLDTMTLGENLELRNVGGGTTYAMITAGNNQTLMAIYTVPNGYTAYITNYYADGVESIGKEPKSVDFKLWTKDNMNGYAFQLKHSSASSKGNTRINHNFLPYMKVTEKHDIKISGEASGQDASVHAGFDIILVSN